MKGFTKQMWEAAGWTFLETFLVLIAPSVAVLRVGDWGALGGIGISAGLSAAAAAVSIIKSLAVRNIGVQDSPFISGGTPEVPAESAVVVPVAVVTGTPEATDNSVKPEDGDQPATLEEAEAANTLEEV